MAQGSWSAAAVWLALALAVMFGVLDWIDRWGVWVTPALNAGPLLVGGVALAVVSIRRRAASRTTRGPRSNVLGSQQDVGASGCQRRRALSSDSVEELAG